MITKKIQLAVETLENEDLVAIPTETVYGLAGNAYSEKAINKIYALKNRPFNNPLIVHIKSIDFLSEIAKDIPEVAYKLAEKFWPGPLTLILKKKDHINNFVTGGKETVAVRVPNHAATLRLLENLDFPIAAPSANPFSSISPTSAQHVYNYFNESVKIILDGGVCKKGIESTIIGFEDNNPILYRYGAITIEEIQEVVDVNVKKTENNESPEAPGMFLKHYAPKTICYLTDNVEKLSQQFYSRRIGLLLFHKRKISSKVHTSEILSDKGNLEEAAQNLYHSLHILDRANLDLIIIERLPEVGLGITINDRLKRASKFIM